MQLVSDTIIKPFSEVEPGELVAFGEKTSRELGVMLAHDTMGVFISNDEPHPQLVRQNFTGPCMSFGTHWVIDPTHGERSFPSGQHASRNMAGLLAQTASGWLMSFAVSGNDQFGRAEIEWWNLNNNQKTDSKIIPWPLAIFPSWAIWSVAEARPDIRAGVLAVCILPHA